MTTKAKFLRFVGNVWLYGKDVATYKVENGVRLGIETVGGKSVGPSRTVSEAEFEQLLDVWTQGGVLARGDARIAQAAIAFVNFE